MSTRTLNHAFFRGRGRTASRANGSRSDVIAASSSEHAKAADLIAHALTRARFGN